MTDDLKERLRANHLDECYEAVDRIEELSNCVAVLEANRAKAVITLKLLVDVSVMMQSSTSHDRFKHNTIITDSIWSQWSKQLKFARSTLAELKGQDHDTDR